MLDVGQGTGVPTAIRYNEALNHPTIRATVRFLAGQNRAFDSRALIETLCSVPSYPEIKIGDLLAAAATAGVPLTGTFASPSEMHEVQTPFLTFLKRSGGPTASVDLVQIERLKRRRVLMRHDRFGEETISIDDLTTRWSGVVLTLPGEAAPSSTSEIETYRAQVSVLPDFLPPGECRELIAYCEDACFTRSRVVQRQGASSADVVEARVRSSSSVVLADRDQPVLARLYERCAQIEGVSKHHIETIQCVRYRQGQRFRAHFDGGVDLPRLTTFLLYLNDNFEGGETYFPMTGQSVAPTAGACLRFPSCDPSGRILWQSEHGGLPVLSGVKYALNIWVRCPAVRHVDQRSVSAELDRLAAQRSGTRSADSLMPAPRLADVRQ